MKKSEMKINKTTRRVGSIVKGAKIITVRIEAVYNEYTICYYTEYQMQSLFCSDWIKWCNEEDLKDIESGNIF